MSPVRHAAIGRAPLTYKIISLICFWYWSHSILPLVLPIWVIILDFLSPPLSVVLEVGSRTKSHAADLARQVDILPDDIRNFLQRWIIVQVSSHVVSAFPVLSVLDVFSSVLDRHQLSAIYICNGCLQPTLQSFEGEKESASLVEEEAPPREREYTWMKKKSSEYGPCSHESSGDYRVQSTPVNNTRTSSSSAKWSLSLPTVSSWFSSSCPSSSLPFVPTYGTPGRTGSDISDRDRQQWLDPLAQKMSNESYSRRPVSLERDRGKAESVSGILWKELVKQAEKFADTDMQLAGLIWHTSYDPHTVRHRPSALWLALVLRHVASL